MSNTELVDKILKDLYDNITESRSIHNLSFDEKSMSKYYYRRRMVREQISKHFKILFLKEIIMNSVIIVYFIYKNRYCRLAITDSSNHAKFLSNVTYEK